MKRLLLITIVFLTAWNATNATAQPKTGLKPDETVLLYAEKLSGCTDPVIAEKVTAAGFTMAEDNLIGKESDFTSRDGRTWEEFSNSLQRWMESLK